MNVRPRPAAERWVGLALLVLASVTISGWLFHQPLLTQWFVGLVPMVFNTGLSFVLVGLALMAGQGRSARRLRLLLVVSLVALNAITLVELVLDRNLGVDFPGLHTWFDYGNTRPGRMAPNTALGFLLIGSAFFVCDRVARASTALLTVALTFAVMAVGLTGLVGYLLAPDLLFGWARSARMAIHTAVGMLLSAGGLWFYWSRAPWYTSEIFVTEGTKIRVLSAAILLVVTVTAGLSGFVLLQHSLEDVIEAQLSNIATSRGPWLQAFSAQATSSAAASVMAVGLAAPQVASDSDPDALQRQRGRAAAQLMALGYRGVAFTEGGQEAAAHFGRFTPTPDIAAPLDTAGTSTLVWDDGFVLRTRLDLGRQADGQYAAVLLDQSLPALGQQLFKPDGLASTVEVAACRARGEREIICVPNSVNKVPFVVPKRLAPAEPLPMQRALAGETGVAYSIDYRGRNVIAAYTALAPGFGLVAKQDTEAAYTPIRSALAIGAPVIVALGLLGALAMYSQLTPLLIRMTRSELLAAEAITQVRTVMEAAGDAIVTIDEQGYIQSANAAAHEVFGYLPGALLVLNVSVLMPSMLRGAHLAGMAAMRAGAPPRVAGRRDIQMIGLRQDGSEFPMELTVNAVPATHRPLFVGVMRDITIRKQTEERLSRMAEFDSLTGLPNRALFMDRLSTALLRALRSQQPIALMFIDLDGFKSVNDTLGHAAGDELLKEVARRLAAVVRVVDTVARLGGDEFTVVLEDLKNPIVDADRVAAKLLESLRMPYSIHGHALTISASVGLIVHDPAEHQEADAAQLLHGADEAMYAAKRGGKNAVVRR